MLFADMDVPEGEPIGLGRVIQPKVEAEIAIVVGRDLLQPDLTIAELIRAVEYVVPAIEVVDSRIANWDIRILDTIADNASSGLFVLGRSEEHTSELQSLMRISYAVFCLKKKKHHNTREHKLTSIQDL